MGNSKKQLGLLLLIIGFSFFFSGVNGQQTVRVINLREAIMTALDSNLTIRSASYSTDLSRALRGAAIDIPKTAIDGQYGQFNSYTNDNSLSISQSIAFPSVYINRYKLANANIKSSELQFRISQLEIATQVKQAYWQIVYLKAKQNLLAFQDSLYSGFMRAAELRAKSGETNRLEMITARSQSLEIENQLFQVSADVGIYSRKLKNVLNCSFIPDPIEEDLHLIEFTDLADSLVAGNNPLLGFVEQKVEISKIENKLERSQMLPDLSIGYFSQTIVGSQEINGVSRNFGNDYRFSGIQAGISIPIWITPFSSRAKAAKINENIARTDAESYSKFIAGNLQSLLDEYSKFASAVDYYEKQAVPEADLIIDQAAKSYKAGALDYLDYVLTLNRALSIKQNYIETLNNCNQTIIAIEHLTGKIL